METEEENWYVASALNLLASGDILVEMNTKMKKPPNFKEEKP